MELYSGRYMWKKLMPDFIDQILNRTHFTFHKGNIQIQITVIQNVHHMSLDNATERFCIYNKAGLRVWATLDSYIQFKIVTMPVLIGTFPKNSVIFLLAPCRIVQLMGCIEMFLSGKIKYRHMLNGMQS